LVAGQRSRLGACALSFGFALALPALAGSRASLAAASPPPAPGTILTFAGNGQDVFSGDGGPATQAGLSGPLGLAFDAAGDLFVGSHHGVDRVRRIDAAGIITTVAGSGEEVSSGDGGPATSAGMQPVGLTVGPAGDLYIADVGGRIRRVDTSGIITTVAGGGNPADGVGDGGPATEASLNAPVDLALDARGNLFIVEHVGQRVRMVAPDGTISTVAGTGEAGFTGDGGPATAAQLYSPVNVAVDNAGRIYISDVGNHRVRRVDPDGMIHTVAGGGNPVDGLGDGGLATDAFLNTPTFVLLDGAGNLFITDNRTHRIRRVGMSGAGAGIITTVAGTGKAGFSGDGGVATQADLSGPFKLAMDRAGNLYFGDVGPFANGVIQSAGNARIREVVGVGVPR
jgi:sugar lactone lactonase YvrE